MDFNTEYCTTYIPDRIQEQTSIVRKYEDMEIKPIEGVPSELLDEIKKSKTRRHKKSVEKLTSLRVQRAYCMEGLNNLAMESEFYNDFSFDRRYNEFKPSIPSKTNPWELDNE